MVAARCFRCPPGLALFGLHMVLLVARLSFFLNTVPNVHGREDLGDFREGFKMSIDGHELPPALFTSLSPTNSFSLAKNVIGLFPWSVQTRLQSGSSLFSVSSSFARCTSFHVHTGYLYHGLVHRVRSFNDRPQIEYPRSPFPMVCRVSRRLSLSLARSSRSHVGEVSHHRLCFFFSL